MHSGTIFTFLLLILILVQVALSARPRATPSGTTPSPDNEDEDQQNTTPADNSEDTRSAGRARRPQRPANAKKPADDSEGSIPPHSCGNTMFDPMPSGSRKRSKKTRIIGGNGATPNSMPWIISLKRGATQKARKHICGGSLLRVSDKIDQSDIVLTAAHCKDEAYKYMKVYSVVAGGHDLQNPEPEQQEVELKKFVIHEDYDDEAIQNDIAILVLKTPVNFTNTVQPICLPLANDFITNGTGLVAGWGDTVENRGTGAAVLQKLEVPIIGHKKCASMYKTSVEPPNDLNETIQLCAGFAEGGKDSCQGDSGGPLIFKRNKGYVLQGVVSSGDGCAREGKPGLYTRVAAFIDWINDQIAELSSLVENPARKDE